jgi:K+-sensing histidine kinase KdpD
MTPGTGSGLAIAKHCLDRWGGEISFENLPDKGIQVSIAFPLPKTRNPASKALKKLEYLGILKGVSAGAS